jgi:FkbM family methyltransferase
MMLRSLEALNRAPWWRTPVATWGGRFQPPSADRLAYLWPYLLARCVGERGVVYAFEPNPALFGSLEANCRSNGIANVRLHNVALGAQDDTLTLTRSRFNSGDSRLSHHEASPASGGVSVPVRPLDALLGEAPLDFVKIDVQGWELEVFKGMRSQLAGSRPMRIHFEFWPAGLRRAGSEPAELLAFLGQHGFRLHRTENQVLSPLQDDDYLAGSLKGTKWINLMAIR